ncbi:MAG TPA: hypothetical protein VIE89_06910 [Candidatus Binatia bacterium]|jgi:predicted GH43/DUF377 family glycosyl hydrolase
MIFWPEEPYERFGDVANVVFPCGYTIGVDGDSINLYYGGADSCIALARGSISALLSWLESRGSENGCCADSGLSSPPGSLRV